MTVAAAAPQNRIPGPSTVFADVHASCARLASAHGLEFNADAARTWIASTLTPDVYKGAMDHSFPPLPLRFDSHLDHANFLAVRALLNFGSGYRTILKDLTGRGAWECIQYLCLSLHLDPHPLDARRMADLTAADLASLTNIPTHVDQPTPTPGIVMSVPSPALPLLNELTRVLNETGNILRDRGYASMGQWLLREIGDDRSAARLVSALASTFPAFADTWPLPTDAVNGGDDQPTYILKKAEFLAMDLFVSIPELPAVQWTDVADIAIPSDNVIASVLVHLGILRVPQTDEWAERLPQGGGDTKAIAVSGETMAILRAGAVQAVREMTPMVPETGYDPRYTVFVGSAVWAWAKVGENRAVIPRLTYASTCMF
ncbi:hypothetical protein BC828DRAFT_392226 [Blastocladiella britannica]|nr:hypothetical protein BC828DRAFT_392226 [Blastocladiella britannica]